MTTLSLPPMMRASVASDPRADAIAAARQGCDAGTLLWHPGPPLRAAIVLAPEMPLDRAVQTAPLAAMAARDAIGANGPAEMPLHIEWQNRLILDGLPVGQVRAIAESAADSIPDWLILHLDLTFAESIAALTPADFLESWSRHLLHRLATWEEDGPRALHAELDAAAWERESKDPAWLGRDEALGKLYKDGEATKLAPLTDLLERP